jgi:hypothetical protein
MPPTTLPNSTDSKNKFEDLSGVDIAAYANPYDALIEACEDDPVSTPFPVPQAQQSRACATSPFKGFNTTPSEQCTNIFRLSFKPVTTLTA